MTTEDRLRDLLRDPRWTLPAWPDAQARVRRAARRQRLTVTGIGAAVTALITTAAVVPVLLLGAVANPAASTAPAGGSIALPAVGAAGFTSTIYPPAVRARMIANWLRLCPSAAGLEVPGRNVAVASLAVLRQVGEPAAPVNVMPRGGVGGSLVQIPQQQILTSYLRLSDRAFWPRLASGSGITVVVQAARVPVLYSGPLRSYHPVNGPPSLAGVVAAGCGSRIVQDTWVIVSGHAASPTRAAETLFLKRRGHVLVYNATKGLA